MTGNTSVVPASTNMADRTLSRDKDAIWTDEPGEPTTLTTSGSPSALPEKTAKGESDKIPKEADFPSDLTNSGFPLGKTNNSSPSSPPTASTSLPNFLRVPVWEGVSSTTKQPVVPKSPSPTTSASNSAAKGKDDAIAVKSENDIKVYVESTMNELLGWYGLSKMDNADTPQLNINDFPVSQRSPSRPTSTASTAAVSPTSAAKSCSSGKRSGRKDRTRCEDNKLPSDTNNNSSSCGADDEDDDDRDDEDAADDDACAPALVNFHESFPAGNDVSGIVSPEPGGGEVPDSERGVAIVCSWCQKNGNKLFTLEAGGVVKSFCSELCFTQCRRASFKRNKVCEWCKHVRHTLNFVDFQDGDVQLQFCSDKCLNQYKMNIFCTEARQHLQQIQGLSGESGKTPLSNGKGDNQEKEILITPDLWLSAHSTKAVTIKQEVNEEEQTSLPDFRQDNRSGSKSLQDGIEPGEVQDPAIRWSSGTDMSVRSVLSDHSSCSNEEKVGQKVKSPLLSRQRKERLTSRLMTSKATAKTASDSCQPQDRERMRKLLSGSSVNGLSRDLSPSTSSMKERADPHPNLSPHKNIQLPSALSVASFGQQQVNTLPLLPNWATSQLLNMMPSHLNPALAAANISSSLSSLGYVPNPLLYSSLFASTPLAMAAQKDIASSSLAKSRNQSRRELLRDRSLEADRGSIRGESTDRSTRSTSSSYSSSDTPGLSATPGATMTTGPDLSSGFVPGFPQQLPHPLHANDLSQSLPLPHYLSESSVSGMFPLSYSQRGGATTIPLAPHMPAPAATATQSSQLPPVTILVPYPVAVPIPVPVPIPLPIAPEKLFAFFREKSVQAKAAPPTTTTQQWSTDNRAASSMEDRSRASSVSQTINSSPIVSPQPSSKCSSGGRHPYVSSVAVVNSPDHPINLPSGRDSSDSVMMLRREIGVLHQKRVSVSPCSSSGLKASGMSIPHFNLDRSKKARLDCAPQCSEDEAIDLSKLSSRSSTPRVSGSCSEKENTTLVKQESFSDSDADSSSQTSSLTVPRIHIISDQSDASMYQSSVGVALPTTSQQSSYSGRRSRILDAPSVPKKMRSPSPERRYIRTVPRDMVEAARRRGLRARVRTK